MLIGKVIFDMMVWDLLKNNWWGRVDWGIDDEFIHDLIIV